MLPHVFSLMDVAAAAELHCSPHTVNFHMKSVYLKLQVHSKSEAVAKALRHRILE